MKDNVNITVEIDYDVFSTVTEFNRKNNIDKVDFNHLPFKNFNCVIITRIEDEDELDVDFMLDKLKNVPSSKREIILKEYKKRALETKEERLDIAVTIKDLVLNIKCKDITEIEIEFNQENICISNTAEESTVCLRSRILIPTLEELVKNSISEKKKYDDFLYTTVANVLQLLAYMGSDKKVDIPKERLFTKTSDNMTKAKSKKKKGKKNNKVSLIRNINYSISKEDVIRNTTEYSKREYNRQTDKWFTKGFWRTYKSGKKVWIKPCIKKSRQKVESTNQDNSLEKTYKVI